MRTTAAAVAGCSKDCSLNRTYVQKGADGTVLHSVQARPADLDTYAGLGESQLRQYFDGMMRRLRKLVRGCK